MAYIALPSDTVTRSDFSQRTLTFEIDDFTDSSGGPCEQQNPDVTNCRLCRIRWQDLDELTAAIGPFPDVPTIITHAPNSVTSRFKELFPNEQDGYRGRVVEVRGVDVLQYESSKPRSRMLRNLRLPPPSAHAGDDKYAVNESFVYKTAEVSLVDPLIPRLVVPEAVLLSESPVAKSLAGHLEELFAVFFADVPHAIRPYRRARLETRYVFAVAGRVDLGSSPASPMDSIAVSSAQRLLPPTEIPLDSGERQSLIRILVDDLVTWEEDHSPSIDGRLVFDLLLYGSIVPADQDRPLLQIKNIQLPLALINPWN